MEYQETIQIKTEIEEEPYKIQEILYFNQESSDCPVKEEQRFELQPVIEIKTARQQEKSIGASKSQVSDSSGKSPDSKVLATNAEKKSKTKVIFRPDSISLKRIQESSEKETQPKPKSDNQKIKFRKNCYKCGEIMNNPRFFAKHISTCQKVASPKSANSQDPKSVNFGVNQKLELITSFPVNCEICSETIISKKHFFEHTLEHAKLKKYPIARKLPQSTIPKTKVIYRASMEKAETTTAESSNNSPSFKQVSSSTQSDSDTSKGTKVKRPNSNETLVSQILRNSKRQKIHPKSNGESNQESLFDQKKQIVHESKTSKPKSKSNDKLVKGNFKCEKCQEFFTEIKQFVDHMMQHSKNKDKVPLNFEVNEDSSDQEEEVAIGGKSKVTCKSNHIFPINCANCEAKLYNMKHYKGGPPLGRNRGPGEKNSNVLHQAKFRGPEF